MWRRFHRNGAYYLYHCACFNMIFMKDTTYVVLKINTTVFVFSFIFNRE